MTQTGLSAVEFEHDDFDFEDIDEELRVDQRCCSLLNSFYAHLQDIGIDVQTASDLAFCADYYLRDYLLDYCRQNVVRPRQGIIRYFAGNWFITHTLDPDMPVLEKHLEAVSRFYRFLHGQHLISADELEYLEQEASQAAYYESRIDSFLAIIGDGYVAWGAECPQPF